MFLGLARGVAGLSACSRASVGCVVVPPDLSGVAALGYNGPPSGLPNSRCRGVAGSCGCVHAEANAVVKLRSAGGGLVLLCTDSPCEACAGLVVNSASVDWVLYLREYRDPAGLDLLADAGLPVARWEPGVGPVARVR